MLEPELNKYGITIYDGNCYPLHRFGLGYDHLKTGIWCDIFPVDVFKTEISNFDESYSLLAPIVKRYRSKYYPCHGNVPERLELDKNKCFSSFYNGDYSLFVHNLDSTFKHCLISSYDMLYPLKRVPFGDYQFPIPSDTHSYLSVLYGKDYMSYPKGGILPHGEATGRAPLSTWAKSNGVNMQEVFSKLLEIYNQI